MYAIFTLFFLIFGCAYSEDGLAWQVICGRDEGQGLDRVVRYPLYRAKVPKDWIRKDSTESVADTTRPLVEYSIDGNIVVTVHNFPADALEKRIPPEAQIERWKRQLNGEEEVLKPQAHGGFAGLALCAVRRSDNNCSAVLGWAMQLAPEHFQNLQLAGTEEEMRHFRQMRSDYTIKAKGPPDLIEQHKSMIELFADSFELIEELPTRP